MNYIDENLKRIASSKNVLMIKPYTLNHKRYLGALITNQKGEYEIVPLTKPESVLSFLFEPIDDLKKVVGKFYMDDFVVFDGSYAFNKKEFVGLGYYDGLIKFNGVSVFAEFRDGSRSSLMHVFNKKYFYNKVIQILNNFQKTNGIQAKVSESFDKSCLIDLRLNGSVASIPSIKAKSEIEK